MTRTVALLVALLLAPQAPAVTIAAARSATPQPPPLSALPSIPRVRVEVASDHVVVLQEVDLPRGDWRSGELAFYVAFGAPGAPEAFDAHLLTVPDGALEPLEADGGEKLATDAAPRRPATARDLIGPEDMAGVVVHVPETMFRRAVAPGGMAALRLRTLLRLPAGNGRSGRDVLVRLGHARTTPLTLGRVQVAAVDGAPPVTRAEARLCGESADPWPLAVAVEPKPSTTPQAGPQAPIAPVLAVRHADDNLCVRFWLAE